MLYFTEGKTATEDPVALNDEFEAQCDPAKYERKISRLMHRVSKRLRKDRSPALETWDQAIRRLRRGDHYLLVIRRQRPGIHGPEIVGFSVAALLLAAIFSLRWLTHQIAPPNPYVIRAVFRAIIFAIVFFPAALGNAFGWILDKFTRKERDEE